MSLVLVRAARPLAVLMLIGALGVSPSTAATPGGTRPLSNSVRLPDASGQNLGSARIVRTSLTAQELAAPMQLWVSLKMRNFPELQARVAAGGRVSDAEMEARYLPLVQDRDRVAAWLRSQGLTLAAADRIHMNIPLSGSVADVARVLGIRFARVSLFNTEFTSAVEEPNLPADLQPVVLTVNGLQPQFEPRHTAMRRPATRDVIGSNIYVTPDNIAAAYSIPAGLSGAGQTIAILGTAPPLLSDLTAFWTAVNSSQVVGNVTIIDNNLANPGDMVEASADVEWAGAIAPAANIRLYTNDHVFGTLTQVVDDLPNYPSMKVLSVSFGASETSDGASFLMAGQQVFAYFAANGVSLLASSGDAGSNPNGNTASGGYSATAPLDVSYPASDPSVTGVGGTTVNFVGTWSYAGEVVWDDISSTSSATGGGVSGFFAKPSWQTGSVPAGQTMRCVPDISAVSDGYLQAVNVGAGFLPFTGGTGELVYDSGAPTGVNGTSLACPVLAAITALINQSRASAGIESIGLLNPYLYQAAGSSAINDVTSGTNGAYTAGPGYDFCSGVGTPNVTNLLTMLMSAPAAPPPPPPAGPPPAHRLVNISTRAQVQTGANIVIAGFVISGTNPKEVLVRAVGPGLAAFNVAGVLAAPVLSLFDSASTLIATDTGWGNTPVAGTSKSGASYRTASTTDMSSVGAFALTAQSGDSAMVLTLPPGAYTAQVSGVGSTTGVALPEVYELSQSTAEVLVNISARCFVGTNASVAISGFVVAGNQSAQLMIRGIGPALGAFGVSGALAQPSVSLFDSNNVLIASNTGWGTSMVPGTSSAPVTYRLASAADMAAVNAFAIPGGSADSAMVVVLPPGQYTAQISGVGGLTGTCLAEVYQMAGP
jgi:kumamolisin